MIISRTRALPPKLKYLTNSPYLFYLTGSRYWGTNDSYSDWDFFVQDSEEVKQYLQNCEFYKIDHEYTDKNTIHVYGDDPTIDNCNINIQLVADAQVKNIAQKIIKALHPDNLTKDDRSRKRIWDHWQYFAANLINEIKTDLSSNPNQENENE